MACYSGWPHPIQLIAMHMFRVGTRGILKKLYIAYIANCMSIGVRAAIGQLHVTFATGAPSHQMTCIGWYALRRIEIYIHRTLTDEGEANAVVVV